MSVLWVVGPPGAGKTTLVKLLLSRPLKRFDKPKWTLAGEWVAAGHYTEQAAPGFEGADTVPYNGAEAALSFWKEMLAARVRLTVLDGDRFSNATAKGFFERVGQRLLCVHLAPDEAVVAARRAARGSNQNPTWVKGRATKARNFYEGFSEAARLEVSSCGPPEESVSAVRRFLEAHG